MGSNDSFQTERAADFRAALVGCTIETAELTRGRQGDLLALLVRTPEGGSETIVIEASPVYANLPVTKLKRPRKSKP